MATVQITLPDQLAQEVASAGLLAPDEQSVVKEVLESLIIKYQTRRWDSSRTAAAAKRPAITKRTHAAAHR